MTSFGRRALVTWRRRHRPSNTQLAVIVVTSSVVASYVTRQWRHRHLEDLPLAKDVIGERRCAHLVANVTRAGLMGTSLPGAKSVKEELAVIRKWHQDRGYVGGLVLRELTRPLYGQEGGLSEEEIDPLHLHQRECYYLYYEIRSNGEIRQQIFCRGTTLLADVATCLQSWWIWDDELGCKLHWGFKNHADRLLADVEPLLTPSSDPRTTVELCGHSLGGAVAYIVAMKLRKRGYNVVRVTAVGAPRSCHKESLSVLSEWLPPNSLRIEDDCDPIPYLPIWGAHIGDKLWFVHDGSSSPARYVPFKQMPSWVDSVWINFRLVEVLSNMSKRHRVPNYVSQLKDLARVIEK